MQKILLIDDERQWLDSFKRTLEQHKIADYEDIITVQTGIDAMQALSDADIYLIFLDLMLASESGEDILKQIKAEYPDVIVVIMTGINDVHSAVRCMRDGAADYLVKTSSVDEHIASVRRVGTLSKLVEENKALKQGILASYDEGFESFITCNPKMFSIFRYLTAIATSKEPVLIAGESGVGKGVLAKAFAEVSRPSRPFIAVNMAGLDEQVFSDTLFGHVKGAFTGADSRRTGLIQQADDGILFMDEIGELSMNLQVKLLYLLQDRVYHQLGSDNTLSTDARFVLATNQNIKEKQNNGEFRKDLYHRISTHSIVIPPLRERRDDIPLLFEHFLKSVSAETGVNVPSYDDKLVRFLMSCDYPGNSRQLRAVTYNAVLNSGGNKLSIDDFSELTESTDKEAKGLFDEILPTVDEIVDRLISEAMKRSGNNQRKAAALIGLSQSTLSRKLRGM